MRRFRGGRTDGRTDGRKEIHPCVLQDIGPLGPLPKKEERKKEKKRERKKERKLYKEKETKNK